jgi:methyl-accepting chemotaxis protein
MWDRLSIRFKIPAAILGFALAVGAGIGLSSYFSASSEIQKLTKDRLKAIATNRVSELTDYLHTIEADLKLVSTLPFAHDALQPLITPGNRLTAIIRRFSRLPTFATIRTR